MTGARPSILLALAAGILFGTTGTAAALGPSDAPPLAVGIVRIQVAALVLLPLLGTGWRRLPVLWRHPAILVTAICTSLFQMLFFAAVAQAGVALGTLVAVASQPMFAGLFGWVALRHRPTLGWLVATAVAVAGLVMRSWGALGPASADGLLLALGAGLSAGIYAVAAKFELERGTTTIELPAASFAIGGILLAPLLLTQPLGWVSEPGGLALLLYLGVATMAIANILLTRALHGLPPGPVATLTLTDPVVATLLGVLVLGETLSPVAALGLLLVLTGLVVQGLTITGAQPAQA